MKQFQSDHYFCIGADHIAEGKPCQDYAISEIMGGSAFAIVSDGCSSGGNTDVGARIVTLATAKAIKMQSSLLDDEVIDGASLISKVSFLQSVFLDNMMRLIGVSLEDTLATCLCAVVRKDFCFVRILGDGAVAFTLPNGEIRMRLFTWKKNMPFYPVYQSLDSLATFVAAHGGDEKLKCLTEEIWIRKVSGEYVYESCVEHSIKDGIFGITICLSGVEIDFDGWALGIFSDGVTQIENIDWKDAVSSFLAFKTIAGNFLKRRMMRELKGLRKSGSNPFDDIGCAVICRTLDEEVKG